MGRYKPRELTCVDCGNTVIKVPRWDRPILCLDCGLTRSANAARQMADKSGPAWSNWLASNASGASGVQPIQIEE